MQKHVTVLLEEAVASLAVKKDSVIIDATYGAGGHAEMILQELGSAGMYVGIDVDNSALAYTPKNPHGAIVHLVNDNFKNIQTILSSLHIESVDGILADLGWRIEQFDGSDKGLSFMHDEPLVMTYGAKDTYPFTAHDIVNTWNESVLADILFGYGEERMARRIAKAIVSARLIAPINTTFELRDIVISALGHRHTKARIHPATRTFQALRIAVNDELQVLEAFLRDAVAALAPNGRLAVITFHSLEDRIVKHYFRSAVESEVATLIYKKPVTPTEDEVKANPRARSAKLRVLQKNNNVEQHEQGTYFKQRT